MITIAIDGFSSCGKSTMAKSLAKELGYIYVDSGAMYRAVTLYCIEQGFIVNGEIDRSKLKKSLKEIKITFRRNTKTNQLETYLNDKCVESEIRSMLVSNFVSPVAVIDFVREELVKQQQAMGVKKGIVMDGRDVGTTIFPNAELKIYVTASAEVRAKRRFDELKSKGQDADYDTILKNVQERDYIDMNREISPLRQADDALLIDNSEMTIKEQNEWLLEQFSRVVDN